MKTEKPQPRAQPSKLHTIQIPNGDANRTSINARCRRGSVLRVRIVLYSKPIQGLYERDVRKLKIEKLYAKPSTPRAHTFFQFPNGDAKRTSINARCCRGSVLRVRIVLYSKPIQGLYERDVRKSKIEKLYAKPSTPRVHTFFQFPNGDANRTSINARCPPRSVFGVRIVLYSKPIQGLYERDVRKSK